MTVTVAIQERTNRLVVAPRSVNMTSIGETVRLSARVRDADDMEIQHPVLAWTSKDPAVASVDGQGVVTARSNGQTLVTVTSGALSASVTVSVEQQAHFILASPQVMKLRAAGSTDRIIAFVFDARDNEIQGAELTWTSEDPAVATVDDQGVVTARMEGVTRVTITSGDVSDSVMVVVGEPLTLVVSTESVRLTAIGEKFQIKFEVLDAFGLRTQVPDRNYSWVSEDPDVASVTGYGEVTALMNGETIVTVTLKGMSDSIPVTVAQQADDIVVTPGSVHLSAAGETIQLSAMVLDANDVAMPDAEVTWTSNNPSVASVDDSGLVTSHMAGSANLTVSSAPVSVTVVVSVGEVTSDRASLVHFYHALDGPNWKDNTNWLSDKPLDQWHGITADSEGRVVSIRFFDNDLNGDLPSSLASLSHLEVLSLSDSEISGTIPAGLGDLESLRRVILTFSKLTGSIPSSLGRLSNLTVLDLQANKLTGSIPSSLGNLSKLAYLRLAGNPMSGSIPSSLGRLDKLQRLYLSRAGLTGQIPTSFGGLSSLIELYMAKNSLTGTIPDGLGRLENLISLRLTDNAGLKGPLPRTFLDRDMEGLYLFGTQVCIPTDDEFQEWRISMHFIYALNCEP